MELLSGLSVMYLVLQYKELNSHTISVFSRVVYTRIVMTSELLEVPSCRQNKPNST